MVQLGRWDMSGSSVPLQAEAALLVTKVWCYLSVFARASHILELE